ncbi:MAG: L,D-transpeptidase family protein [Gemmatimonadaceae bacterium]|nr:L,D-transpeptidase family protein [Gemmatimonadaceae bacterium]
MLVQAVAFMVSAGVSSAQSTAARAVRDSAGDAISAIVASGRHAAQRWPVLSDVTTDLRRLYTADSAGPRWSAAGRATASALLVVQQLERMEARGLNPVDYDVDRLRQLASGSLPTRAQQAEFDVMMSTASLRALRGLRYGRVSATAAHAQLQLAREPYDAVAALRQLTQSANPSLQFDQAEPPFLHYHLLKDAMARYRQLARDSTLLPVSLRGTLRPASTDTVVPALRRLLIAVGDVPSTAAVPADSLLYDSVLVRGVTRFQQRQGLSADGVIGPATLTRLRRPFADRVAQMALTLERWRWLPHAISDPPPIIVNIPAFRLHAFTTNSDRESELISMDVVVGQAYNHRTPVFSGSLRYLIFSPYWDVPPSITRKEILPAVRRDRSYLTRGHYEVVSNGGAILGTSASAVSAVEAGRARIRQKPGPTNALGGVKFIFPNAFNVYLHDTPAQSVFARARRDASHGCIRIAHPARLAQFLLRDQPGFDSTAIARAMSQVRPQQVNLTRPVPVHIMYATAVAREDGVVLFHEDIYRHDRSLTALLARGYPYSNSRR